FGFAMMMPHAIRDDSPRARFFETVHFSNNECFNRLGKIYEAGWQQARAAAMAQYPHISHTIDSCFDTAGLEWLQFLLTEAFQLARNVWPPFCRSCPALNAGMVETILRAAGHGPELLVQAAFQPDLKKNYGRSRFEAIFVAMAGI